MTDDVTIFPIVGWQTATTPAGYGVLHISAHPGVPPAGTSQAELERATQSLQFGIAAEQAELLGHDLLALAARLREKRKTSN